ncbi:MAG: PBP1A family penicillin-binding protein [Candidatus Blackburnbacteria bacterium]|nr:PBP1A family penicillin-binding protein [Candidatus Blackburnbacteria bacterium]
MAWRSSLKHRRHDFAHSRRPVRGRAHLLHRIAVLFFVGVIGLFVFSLIIFPLFAFGLPSPDKVVRREGFSTKIYDRNEVLLYDLYLTQRRTPVKLEDVPQYLKQATIAVEDKNFYKHGGFDPTGMVRAIWNIIIYRKLQGGSTLTQQLVKNVLLTSERTLPRKIKEFILSIQIERKYKKDEILNMYLNEAPYGGTAWGVQAASEVYFGKNVKDLTLVEAAILAGLPQRPSKYSPYGTDQQAYVGRSEHVLRRMREDGYITKEQEEEAKRELNNVKFVGRGASLKAPHFVTYVQGLLEERYGQATVEQGGLKIITTLDWTLQEKAQQIIAEEIAKVESLHITNGASVVVNPQTGEILAMVGSKDFTAEDYDGQVNVTLSLRQPGSAIKPVTYATALKKGYTAATLLMDAPTTFPGGEGQPDYEPVNYDDKHRGPVQVRFALGNSLNIPAVKMLALVGVKDMLSTAYDLGFKTLEPTKENMNRFGLSVTLGGGEIRLLDMTSAYGAFANGGLRFEPVSILKVEDQKGKVLEEYKEEKGRRVLGEGEAFIISNILSDNEARADVFGTRSALVIPGHTVAVKTGTTNDQRDNWTMGWTPQVVVGVWVGNNDNSQMKKVASGITGASPIWRRITTEALSGKPNTNFTMPENVITGEVDKISGYKSHDGYPSRMEYFIKGTEPTGEDPVHTRLKLCKGEGKLATPSQVAAGDYEEKEYFVFKEEDPFAKSSEENRWQKGILDWMNTQTDELYRSPSEYCGSANPVNVEFVTPKDHEQVNSNNFEVRVDAKSTSNVTQVELEFDGQRYLLTSKPWKQEFRNVKTGVYNLVARARDEKGNQSDRKITIGVSVPWNYSTTPTPTPTP